ncbi:hypothetical protein ON010_g9506 [Phytophthora cinnamomi]|nr:hypothetical protein ON010_g9506 [Phytophthora cinnamomi]
MSKATRARARSLRRLSSSARSEGVRLLQELRHDREAAFFDLEGLASVAHFGPRGVECPLEERRSVPVPPAPVRGVDTGEFLWVVPEVLVHPRIRSLIRRHTHGRRPATDDRDCLAHIFGSIGRQLEVRRQWRPLPGGGLRVRLELCLGPGVLVRPALRRAGRRALLDRWHHCEHRVRRGARTGPLERMGWQDKHRRSEVRLGLRLFVDERNGDLVEIVKPHRVFVGGQNRPYFSPEGDLGAARGGCRAAGRSLLLLSLEERLELAQHVVMGAHGGGASGTCDLGRELANDNLPRKPLTGSPLKDGTFSNKTEERCD